MCTTASSTLPAAAADAITGVLPVDIIQFNILTCLDGPTLTAASCVSSQLRQLSARDTLWADVCQSTWPSTNDPRTLAAISAFPGGHRSFFSDSYSLPAVSGHDFADVRSSTPAEIISAVDIHHRGKLIFSQVVSSETVTAWFKCSPFRIDMLEPKEVVATPVPYPDTNHECRQLGDGLTLSWIVIDPAARRAANVSSRRPVSVIRHWLSGEVHARFATVLPGEIRSGSSSEFVECGAVVTCGGSWGGDLQVIEVSLQVEDMDGKFLNGRESLAVLRRALAGGRRTPSGVGRGDEVRRMHEEFQRMKMERKERRLRAEGTLDMICVALGFFLLMSLLVLCIITFCRW
ncbi:hypothetical protein SAY87_030028 [Trapa incisa]|uniref:F-box domain-containing protein n=1 Tax=Trapa incisa TaxID=236973 RepID=A0AAN7K8N4_9MYRT|nr:hypothetical protein SAY87_030028 [Trapa incisa]